MPQRPRADGLKVGELTTITFHLPPDLVQEIKLLSLDPRTGRMPARGWSRIVEAALRDWLNSQKIIQPTDLYHGRTA